MGSILKLLLRETVKCPIELPYQSQNDKLFFDLSLVNTKSQIHVLVVYL